MTAADRLPSARLKNWRRWRRTPSARRSSSTTTPTPPSARAWRQGVHDRREHHGPRRRPDRRGPRSERAFGAADPGSAMGTASAGHATGHGPAATGKATRMSSLAAGIATDFDAWEPRCRRVAGMAERRLPRRSTQPRAARSAGGRHADLHHGRVDRRADELTAISGRLTPPPWAPTRRRTASRRMTLARRRRASSRRRCHRLGRPALGGCDDRRRPGRAREAMIRVLAPASRWRRRRAGAGPHLEGPVGHHRGGAPLRWCCRCGWAAAAA